MVQVYMYIIACVVSFVLGFATYILLYKYVISRKCQPETEVGHVEMVEVYKGRLRTPESAEVSIIQDGKVKKEKKKAIMTPSEATDNASGQIEFAQEYDVRAISEVDNNRG